MPTTSKTGPGRSHRTGISLPELFKLFPDDAAAEAWFVRMRWPSGEIACHHCGSFNVQVGCAHKSMPYRCRERDCAKRFSVRTGTVMQSSKLGYQVWAIATYLMLTSLKGVSSMKLHRDLNITQKTAWHLAHRLREALTASDPERFAGPVEADESYFGGKAKNMHVKKRKELTGRGATDKVGVIGVKDQKTRKVRAAVIEPGGPTLKSFVKSHIVPGAAVFTDEASAYRGMPNHDSVTHGIGEYVRGQVTINGMESFWSMLKRGVVGTFHHISREHLSRYVGEFEGRHNIRDDDTIDQMESVARDSEGKQLRYRDLIEDGVRVNRIARGWTPPIHWKHRRQLPPAPIERSGACDSEGQ